MKHPNKHTIPLQRIDIAAPCTASWDDMRGDERVRHCNDCNKNVFNLSAMPEADATRLLADNHQGDLCVRFYQRQDGTVMTSDCGDSQRATVRQAWRGLPHMAGAAALALSAAGAAFAAAPAPATAAAATPAAEPPAMRVTMGAPPATRPSREPEASASEAIGQKDAAGPHRELTGKVAAAYDRAEPAGKGAQRKHGVHWEGAPPVQPAK
ncbi:hypothetical protein [Massilia genomosp. 1]|uniref:Uncharacterized protein n=1 Tax=Massilia genomosp. 1 TaxID=2609280 RepID=A0ABX0MV54_9BURK|nr:hypothetical protein [Massilia genomosp. 1]NHZ63382.1 hypothetical protein [Massilia genomosp. 1]